MAVYTPVRALERGLRLLEAVNAAGGLTSQEAATECGLSRATAYRLLETLAAEGFVVQSPSDLRWRPTLQCCTLSSGFLDKAWIGQIAAPEMVKLGEKILWPLDLTTLSGDAMLIRETTHKTSPFSFDVGMVGRTVPLLLSAAGHAYLSWAPEEERAALLEMMRGTGKPEHVQAHEPRRIAAILERSRARGYGFRTEGFKPHTLSIAMPVMKGGRPVAALSVICLKSAITLEEAARKFAEPLAETCAKIGAMAEAAPE